MEAEMPESITTSEQLKAELTRFKGSKVTLTTGAVERVGTIHDHTSERLFFSTTQGTNSHLRSLKLNDLLTMQPLRIRPI